MKELAQRLSKRQNESKKLPDLSFLIYANKALERFHYCGLPQAYAEFLKECNGFQGEGCCLYGIYPEQGNFNDIVNANRGSGDFSNKTRIILGENEFDYLIYDKAKEEYQIVDKNDKEVLEEYNDLEEAIIHILKL